ncbi:MAG: bifunctional riboflavin kinase/FAD synthetase [Deltaproteobacteria bacterium]|jgi:riboflavin kinase/FMN adenylyltransferase|nr:bifunctional riboflavin kinase/FAD synthetase [Deltaproteobacteria bacterium]
MIIVNDWASYQPVKKPRAVLTVGVFDGLHLGHQRLIGEVVERAGRQEAASVVLTFEPHPLALLSSAQAPEVLTTLPQKAEILESLGVDVLGRLEFNESLRMTPPSDFLRDYLERKVELSEIVVGPDFRFGKDAEGHTDLLCQWAKSLKASVTEFALQKGPDDVVYSSSHVRRLLKMGLVEAAAISLGRPYRLSGKVVPGAARGRRLGFPTANLGQVVQLIPGPGVYAVRARLRGAFHSGMTSVGHNPTFANQYLTVETCLFDFAEDFYGEMFEVDFVSHLRGMVKFDGLEGLIRQLGEDERRAREKLSGAWPGL